MTLAFKIFVILLISSIWCELNGICKALEKIARKGGVQE